MKRKYLTFCLLVLGLLVIFLIYIFLANNTNNQIIEIPMNEIQRIYIVDGNTGEIRNVIKSKMDVLYDDLNAVLLSNGEKADSTGWNKKIVFCTENQEIPIIINSKSKITIDGKKYKIDPKQGEKILLDIEDFTE